MLAKESPVPLYYQLAEHIRARIQSGDLQQGDRLPSERELAQQAEVSRMTARQALAYLTQAGLVTVRHGVGAFVAAPKVTYSLLTLRSFTESMAQQGQLTFSRVLTREVVPPPPNVAVALRLAEDDLVVKLVRLRGVETLPLLLETTYIVASLCPGLDTADLTDRSLYKFLEQECGLRVVHASQNIQAATANGYEESVFGIEPGSPMLRLEGITYTNGNGDDDTPFEYFRAVYRGDRCSFALSSQRTGTIHDTAVAQLNVRI